MQIWKAMELNFEGLKMQKWNIPVDWARRVDKKSGVICLLTTFTFRVMVIKMSKMCFFCIFSWWLQIILSQFGQNNYVHLKDFI